VRSAAPAIGTTFVGSTMSSVPKAAHTVSAPDSRSALRPACIGMTELGGDHSERSAISKNRSAA
jgi:hypothetical protein